MNATAFDQPVRPRAAAAPAALTFDTGTAPATDDARFDSAESRRFRAAAAALALLLTAGAAQAQSGRPPSGDTVTVGLGAGISTDYDGANEYRVIPGGNLRGTVAGHDFFLRGLQLNFDAIPNGAIEGVDLSLGPVLGVRLDRTGRVRDARVAALGERDAAVELGAFAAIGTANGFTSRNDSLALRISYVRDVAGAHRSHLIAPSIDYSRRYGRRTFTTLSLSAEFAGDRYARYYFDVSPARSAASGLTPHAASGGLKSLGGSVVIVRALSDRPKGWSLFGILSYNRLQGDFARSPIVAEVGSADQAFAALGVGYTF